MSSKSPELIMNAYFPTLVFQVNVPEPEALNKDLLKLIYQDRENDSKGVNRSNVASLGGWHSQIRLHKDKAYAPLVREINSAGRKISKKLGFAKDHALKIGSMWSIINPPGGMNIAHVHPGCMWSGVYYVQAPEKAGQISFTDPRTVNLMNQAKFMEKKKRPKECWTKVNFVPKAGKLLIFPAWLYHSVDTNATELTGDEANRIVIAFNINQQKIPEK